MYCIVREVVSVCDFVVTISQASLFKLIVVQTSWDIKLHYGSNSYDVEATDTQCAYQTPAVLISLPIRTTVRYSDLDTPYEGTQNCQAFHMTCYIEYLASGVTAAIPIQGWCIVPASHCSKSSPCHTGPCFQLLLLQILDVVGYGHRSTNSTNIGSQCIHI